MRTPEQRRRRATIRRVTGKEGGEGAVRFLTIGEIAQRLEFELQQEQVAYGKKRLRRTDAQRAEKWQRDIVSLQTTISLLRRDRRLCEMPLMIPASPAGLATFERDILGDEEVLRSLLAFADEARARGYSAMLLLIAEPPAEHRVMAIGQDDLFAQSLRGGERTHSAMKWAPTPAGLGPMPLASPDWPPSGERGQ